MTTEGIFITYHLRKVVETDSGRNFFLQASKIINQAVKILIFAELSLKKCILHYWHGSPNISRCFLRPANIKHAQAEPEKVSALLNAFLKKYRNKMNAPKDIAENGTTRPKKYRSV